MRTVSRAIAILAALATAVPAAGWTRPGHMVTAAIAYDDLKRSDPALLDEIIALLEHHPDRGAFEVAIGRSTGADRAQRSFRECARWPDDARGTAYDHPSWHVALRPIVSSAHPPPVAPADTIVGDAVEAFALQRHVLANRSASDAERAVALCWVMHLAGDVHQPLHNAQLFSDAYPAGDKAGSLQYVREGVSDAPITLHWYWDDSVNRQDSFDAVTARTVTLVRAWPRSTLPTATPSSGADDFKTWAGESYPIARDVVYASTLAAGPASAAPMVSKTYRDATLSVAERRLTHAGYRIADVLRDTLRP